MMKRVISILAVATLMFTQTMLFTDEVAAQETISELTEEVADDEIVLGTGEEVTITEGDSDTAPEEESDVTDDAVSSGEVAEITISADGQYYTLKYKDNKDGTCTVTGYSGNPVGTLEIPDTINNLNVTAIAASAFKTSTFKGILKLPTGLKKIGNDAFRECVGFTGVEFPDKLKEIGDRAFSDCVGLKNLVLPAGLTTIGEEAFHDCTAMRGDLTVPAGVYVKFKAFENCGFDGKLTFADGFGKMGGYAFANTKFRGSVVIPDSVSRIPEYAFYKCTNLTGLTIGNNVTAIYQSAFDECTGLKGKIVLPDSVTYLDRYVFWGCKGITGFDLSKNLSTISEGAFYGCKGLTGTLVIPQSLSKCEKEAFKGAHNVSRIDNRSSVKLNAGDFIDDDSYFVKKGTNTPVGEGDTIGKGIYNRTIVAPVVKSVKILKDGMTVKWKGSDGATGYYVSRKVGTGSFKRIATVKGGKTTSYTDKKISNGKKYAYRVFAFNDAGEKTIVSEASNNIAKCFLSQPKIGKLTGGSRALTVKWDKNTKCTGYEVQYSLTRNFAKNSKKINISKKNTVSKKITGLKGNKTYYVRIRSYKSHDGEKDFSAWSATKNVRTTK